MTYPRWNIATMGRGLLKDPFDPKSTTEHCYAQIANEEQERAEFINDATTEPNEGHHFRPFRDRLDHEMVLFPHYPSPDDIQQGKVGNCYLLTALQCIAYTHPEHILNMMRDNKDGTVDVKLFMTIGRAADQSPRPCYIRVRKTQCVTRNNTPLSPHRAPWVHMIEKAYAYVRRHFENPAYFETELKYKEGIWIHDEVGARPPESFKEILKSGQIYLAFSNLLGQWGEQVILQREEILGDANASSEGSPQGVPPYSTGHIHSLNLVKILKTSIINREAFEAIFQQVDQSYIDILQQSFTPQAQLEAKNIFEKTGKITRCEPLINHVETHYGHLNIGQPEDSDEIKQTIYEKLIAYIRLHFPGKRGSGQYTYEQTKLFVTLYDLLKAKACIAFATRKRIGRPDRDISQNPHGYQVRGLAPSHGYQLLDVFQRSDGLRYCLLRNPWGFYGRTYVPIVDQAGATQGIKAIDNPRSPRVYAAEQPVILSAKGYSADQINDLCRRSRGGGEGFLHWS